MQSGAWLADGVPRSLALPPSRKLELILLYFGVRKCSTHLVSLGFFCTLVPLTVFTPEVHIPAWALVHLPVLVTLSTACFTPRGWVYSILYVLFENAMGTVKLWAVVTGERLRPKGQRACSREGGGHAPGRAALGGVGAGFRPERWF